jgi:Gas vesicle synthesis protein GvpL/GvpF
MSLLPYCIVSCRDIASELPDQIAGRVVRLIEVDDLAMAVSESAGTPATNSDEAMAFEAVVEWFLARCRSLIPLRLGLVLPDDEAAARILRERAPEYRRLIHQLEDTFEIGIRVLPEDVPEPQTASSFDPAQSGTAWLEQRREHYRRRDGAVTHLDGINAQLKAALAGAFLHTREEAKPEMLSLYLLVPRQHAESFMERASRVTLPGVKLLVSGPWPPYNFVDGWASEPRKQEPDPSPVSQIVPTPLRTTG